MGREKKNPSGKARYKQCWQREGTDSVLQGMAGTERDVGHCLQTPSSPKAIPRGKPAAISKHGCELP